MITVEHIQASITANGDRIDTLVCQYPRVVHSQLLTHRVFSKNSSSTRAIPLEKAIAQILDNPAEFIWTKNQAGMQGKVIPTGEYHDEIEDAFGFAMNDAVENARVLANLGVHKQNAGRLLEPFQNIRIVLTSTEWENWDWLRDHEAAQGEIAELARKIKQARDEAEPMVLNEGEWHVPFVKRDRNDAGEMFYFTESETESSTTYMYHTPEEAKLVSASVCAQTSYRNADFSLEKAKGMYEKLTGSDHIHASPFEHIATPVSVHDYNSGNYVNRLNTHSWQKGITHMDRKGNFWSGNLKGFIQYRQLIPNHDHAK